MNNVVHIAMISDKGFFMPTCIALLSIKKNKLRESEYNIHIFLCQCGKAENDILEKMDTEDFHIYIEHTNEKIETKRYLDNNISATPTALFKFELAELLNVDKVLYLDGDMLIEKDITGLYNIDLDNKYAAVVMDMPLVLAKENQCKKLFLSYNEYFNSGMMLLNLKKMRSDGISLKLYKYKENEINYFMDQDAFNVIFDNNVIYLDFYYNMVFRVLDNYPLETICDFYNIPLELSEEALLKKAYILHMASKFKPWMYYTPYITEKFLSYYNDSHFKDEKLNIADRVPGRKYVKYRCTNLQTPKDIKVLFYIRNRFDLIYIKDIQQNYYKDLSCDLFFDNLNRKMPETEFSDIERIKLINELDDVYLEMYSDIYICEMNEDVENIISNIVKNNYLCRLHFYESTLNSYFSSMFIPTKIDTEIYNMLLDKSFFSLPNLIQNIELRNNSICKRIDTGKLYDLFENDFVDDENSYEFYYYLSSNFNIQEILLYKRLLKNINSNTKLVGDKMHTLLNYNIIDITESNKYTGKKIVFFTDFLSIRECKVPNEKDIYINCGNLVYCIFNNEVIYDKMCNQLIKNYYKPNNFETLQIYIDIII